MRQRNTAPLLLLLALIGIVAGTASCARMGQPDGGWYDETPPRVVATNPTDGATGVKAKRVEIVFDEYIKLENATEKVVVSPPQLEAPEIKSTGRRIVVSLNDTLKPETTYTIDFSDAISDNNEGNPMGNYTYSFSTGDAIDTLEVSGYVLAAEDLEPVKGILVGLYDDMADTAFNTKPMIRVSRTDSRGRFTIKGVAEGNYRIVALQDADGDYRFTQKSEAIGFQAMPITPTCRPDVRQDTLWADSLHIRDIVRTPYTHYLPDDIVLRSFTEQQTDRYLIKAERREAEHFDLYFSYADGTLPEVRGLDFDSRGMLSIERSERADTLKYWLLDTTLVNRDTLTIEARYLMTDTTGLLTLQTDTLELISKQPKARRDKQREKDLNDWQKKQDKLRRRGEAYDTIPPVPTLNIGVAPSGGVLDPDQNVSIEIEAPVRSVDLTKIHLYAQRDTLWYNTPFLLSPTVGNDSTLQLKRRFTLRAEWRPDMEYSLELDSMAFTDVYGKPSKAIKRGLRVPSMDEYSTLVFTFTGLTDSVPVVVELLDAQDKAIKRTNVSQGTAQFFYLKPQRYYARLFVDTNANGRWDTGEYASGRQPESVSYYPTEIECKAKWDLRLAWDVTARPIYQQKPPAITRQKAEQQKKVRQRNAERARKLGIEYIPTL